MRRAHTAMVGGAQEVCGECTGEDARWRAATQQQPEQRGQVRVACTNEAGQREDKVGAAERGGGHQCPDHKAGGANAAGGDGDQPGR